MTTDISNHIRDELDKEIIETLKKQIDPNWELREEFNKVTEREKE